MPMALSSRGVEFIAEHEGTGPIQNGLYMPYNDVTGNPTIGYGHLITEAEAASGEFDNGISEQDALSLLNRDTASAEDAVNRYVSVDLTQNQFDALVSFVFNVGSGNFSSSTLLKLLNAGNYNTVPAQLLRWNKSGGREIAGLTKRRRDEGILFTTPDA